jgi:hypothetical protein
MSGQSFSTLRIDGRLPAHLAPADAENPGDATVFTALDEDWVRRRPDLRCDESGTKNERTAFVTT